MSTRLRVSKVAKGRKLIKDIPRISLEFDSCELDESEDEELESYSDPTYAPGSGSDGEDADVEASCLDAEADASPRHDKDIPTNSSGSHSEGSLAEEAPPVDKPLELESYQWEDLSSTVPWVSHGDVVIENRSPGSGSSSIFEEDIVHPEIGEGFDRVRELVDELLSVDKSYNEIEANAEFVHGLLRKLSDHVTDIWGSDGPGEEEAAEDKSTSLDIKKVLEKEVWLTKCDTKIVHPGRVVDSQEESEDLPNLLQCLPISIPIPPTVESSPMKTVICPTTAITSPSPDSSTSIIDDSVESQDCLLQACSALYAASSNPVPPKEVDSPGEPEATEPKAGEKSKYEMIREDIIAERNAQLKAMGFFEEFAVLRSDMNPTKKHKIKKKQKKQPQTTDLFEKNRVRRSERLFLSSPDVDLLEVKNEATDAVVKDVVADIIQAVAQEKVLHNLDQKINKCSDCGKRFKMRRYLMKHTKSVHGKPLTIECQHCDFKTERSRILIKHLANQHSDITALVGPTSELEVLGCDKCSYVTAKKTNLRSHKLRVHEKNGGQPYRCDLCNYVTPYKSYLLRHQTAYHNVEKYGGDFKEGVNVKIHSCNQCNFITKHRSTLWSHKTKHHAKSTLEPNILTTDSNFMDDIDMSTSEVVDSDLESVEIFTDDSDQEDEDVIERAESTIKGTKLAKSDNIWSCDICGKVVSNSGNLKRHIRTVH